MSLHAAVAWLKQTVVALFILAYVFITTGLLVNFLQLLSCVIWPFSRSLYRKLNTVFCYIIWSQFTFMGQWWSPSELTIRMSAEDIRRYLSTGDMFKRNSVVILNHKYDVDWLAGYIATERMRLLGGTKVFAKKILRFFPIQGWAWYFSEIIFVSRKWETDKGHITKTLKALTSYPEGWPVSILMYCEGTRFTKEKQLLSAEFARSIGEEPLKHHLFPRSKGFVHTMQTAGDKLPVIYDCTVGYKDDGAKPTFMNILMGRRCVAEMHIRRLSTAEIPKDEEGCSKWLKKLYREKDQRFDDFCTNQRFDGEVTNVDRRYHDLLTWLGCAAVTLSLLAIFLYRIFTTGSFVSQVVTVLVLFAFTLVMKGVAAVTEIERSSTYGQGKST